MSMELVKGRRRVNKRWDEAPEQVENQLRRTIYPHNSRFYDIGIEPYFIPPRAVISEI